MTSAGSPPQRIFSGVYSCQPAFPKLDRDSTRISHPDFELLAMQEQKVGWFRTTFWESWAWLRVGTGDAASGQKAARSRAQWRAELSLSIQRSRPERNAQTLSRHAQSHTLVFLGGKEGRGTGRTTVPPAQQLRHRLLGTAGAGRR